MALASLSLGRAAENEGGASTPLSLYSERSRGVAPPVRQAQGKPRAQSRGGLRDTQEMFRLRIVNSAGGAVAVSRDGGRSWRTLGQVTRHTVKVNEAGFTASKWVPAGCVSATAVNAIHITVGYHAEQDRGIIFSLLPSEFASPPTHYRSFLSPDSSIYTDIPAGEGIFGGGEAPLVGNSVCREAEDGTLEPLREGYVPAQEDVLVILVERPVHYPVMAVFENRAGGAIALHYPDGSRRLLGWVVRPVRGIGRFEGTRYAAIGRIRANHAGVVDVSTSPVELLGGFQIIPVRHALSPEMSIAWEKTQWMIVGPAPEDAALWNGLMPLFYQHLRPDYRPDDLYSPDWRDRLLARFLVEIDSGEGWVPLPPLRLAADPHVPLPQWADHALDHVRWIRILFPLGVPGEPLAGR